MIQTAHVVDNPEAIRFLQFCAQLGAAKLEAKGLRHSSGRSFRKVLKERYQLKGSWPKCLEQLERIRDEWRARLEQ